MESKSKYFALCESIENRLLGFAELWPDLTTSDLQGVAFVIAREIIAEVKVTQ